jgi:hypothetical protein
VKVPMPAHTVTFTIGGSLDCATDTEHETIDCPGGGQPVEVKVFDPVTAMRCPECRRTVAELLDDDERTAA